MLVLISPSVVEQILAKKIWQSKYLLASAEGFKNLYVLQKRSFNQVKVSIVESRFTRLPWFLFSFIDIEKSANWRKRENQIPFLNCQGKED